MIIPVAEDTYTRNDQSGNNFGTGNSIETKRNEPSFAGNSRWGWFKYDIQALHGLQITSARVYFYTEFIHNIIPNTQGVYEVPSTWGELTITRGNQPSIGSLIGEITYASTGQLGWHSVDITNYLRSEVVGLENNLSVAIQGITAGFQTNIDYASREASGGIYASYIDASIYKQRIIMF